MTHPPSTPYSGVPFPQGGGPHPPQGRWPYPPPGAPGSPGSAAPYAPAPRRPVPAGNKGPITLLVSGILILALAGVLFLGSATLIGRISASFQPLTLNSPNQISLEASESYGIYTDAAFSARCTVQSPDGSDIDVKTERIASIKINELLLNATFRTDAAGTYTITCDDSPSIDGISVAYVGYEAVPSTMTRAGAGMIGGVLLGLLGLGLAIGGGIWLGARSSARKRQRALGIGPTP